MQPRFPANHNRPSSGSLRALAPAKSRRGRLSATPPSPASTNIPTCSNAVGQRLAVREFDKVTLPTAGRFQKLFLQGLTSSPIHPGPMKPGDRKLSTRNPGARPGAIMLVPSPNRCRRSPPPDGYAHQPISRVAASLGAFGPDACPRHSGGFASTSRSARQIHIDDNVRNRQSHRTVAAGSRSPWARIPRPRPAPTARTLQKSPFRVR